MVVVILGDEITAVLPELRDQAETLMTDACTITRAGTGDPVYDPETNTSTPPAPSTVYAGKCRVQAQALSTDTPLVAVDRLFTSDYTVSIPFGSDPVKVADSITVTASQFDPQIVGRLFRVRGVLHKSQATAYRIQAEVINE